MFFIHFFPIPTAWIFSATYSYKTRLILLIQPELPFFFLLWSNNIKRMQHKGPRAEIGPPWSLWNVIRLWILPMLFRVCQLVLTFNNFPFTDLCHVVTFVIIWPKIVTYYHLTIFVSEFAFWLDRHRPSVEPVNIINLHK